MGYGVDEDLFQTWWPASLHVIGKDITRFHCVIWPAMLMSAGLPLPRQVFGHGWVHWEGKKMSKSLGTVLDPLEAADRVGPDPLRLYLTKEITYGQDGDFTWARFEERYNVDLANNFGNLVNRFATMAHRYRKGRLRAPTGSPGPLAARAFEVAVGQMGRKRVLAHDDRAEVVRVGGPEVTHLHPGPGCTHPAPGCTRAGCENEPHRADGCSGAEYCENKGEPGATHHGFPPEGSTCTSMWSGIGLLTAVGGLQCPYLGSVSHEMLTLGGVGG